MSVTIAEQEQERLALQASLDAEKPQAARNRLGQFATPTALAEDIVCYATSLPERILHQRVGVSVLGFDYRGYGRSEGSPSEDGILADARAARRWLGHRANVPEDRIVLMGRSLGGAVAIDLAAADGARGLVVESTFTSLPEAAQAVLPGTPVRALMRTRLDSRAKIGDYHGPLLHSHGTADRLIPFTMGRRLFESANEPKQFLPLPDLDHNDPQPDSYYVTLSQFLSHLR
ncbi:MAG: alpha/beta hydrolase [Patescibacteria group bacterium]|nr:alpha/beta hydrolase [Patescibacteria group bacterium]